MPSTRPSWLEQPESVAIWHANLAALRLASPALAVRLETAPLGERVQWHDLEAPRPVMPDSARIGVFGLGDPAFLQWAVDSPAQCILAWDRDPALVHHALSVQDYSHDIASARLQFALGADLVHHLQGFEWIVHPQLTHSYAWEFALLGRPLARPLVLVGTGTLFVDDMALALQQEGYAVYPLATALHTVAELDHTVNTLQPQAIFNINYLHGTAEFCARHQVPYRCWEIDPATDSVAPLTEPGDAHIFTYRQANVASWQAHGFASSYLPLASNPERRTPGATSPHGIAFVGTSMVQTAQNYFTRLTQLLSSQGHDEVQSRILIERILANQKMSNTYVCDTLLADQFPHLPVTSEEPAMLLGEIAASQYRLQVIASLADLGMDVWGDEGWQSITTPGVNYKGAAGHFHQLNAIYRDALINVDIGRIYQSDIVTMRVFDVLACGGFVLAAHCEALTDLFEIGQEIDSWRTLEELHDKASWYLTNPERAKAIAARGREKILSHHTIQQRITQMLMSV